MKCNAEIDVKNCNCQEKCCEECSYEGCHEGCDLYYDIGDCLCCKYAIRTVYDEIIGYDLNKLAIYIHSWQGQNYSIEEIKNLLNEDASKFS